MNGEGNRLVVGSTIKFWGTLTRLVELAGLSPGERRWRSAHGSDAETGRPGGFPDMRVA